MKAFQFSLISSWSSVLIKASGVFIMSQKDQPHKITSVNLPTPLKTRLDNAESGNSELVRDLLERYFYLRDEADKGEVNNMQQRVKQLNENIQDKEDEKKQLRQQIQEVENDIAAMKSEKQQLLDKLKKEKVSEDRVVREVNSFKGRGGDL